MASTATHVSALTAEQTLKLQRALASEKFGDLYREAVRLMDVSPGSPIVFCSAGIAASQLKRFKLAEKHFLQGILLNPRDWELRYNFGLCLLKSKNPIRAIKELNQSIELNPRISKTYYILGNALFDLQRFSEAISNYEKCVLLDKHNADAYFNAGLALHESKDFKRAIHYFHLALKIRPACPRILFSLGGSFQKTGQDAAAIRTYETILEKNANHSEALFNLGLIYKDTSSLDKSIELLKRAVKSNPCFPDAHYALGNRLLKRKSTEAAKQSFSEALQLEPSHQLARRNLGSLAFNEKEYEQALAFLSGSQHPESQALCLESLYHLGQVGEYKKLIRRMALEDGSNIRAAALSAFASEQHGEEDPYPFCPNPIKLFSINNLRKYTHELPIILKSLDETLSKFETVWEPAKKSTRNGFQTTGNLFEFESAALKTIENIISRELEDFRKRNETLDCTLIREWPGTANLTGWYVRLLEGGHQLSHIHPAGWVSGVLYLETTKPEKGLEGAIELCLHGYEYPKTDKEVPHICYQPQEGDLILFPSNLFHRTIPFYGPSERRVIAFDLIHPSLVSGQT